MRRIIPGLLALLRVRALLVVAMRRRPLLLLLLMAAVAHLRLLLVVASCCSSALVVPGMVLVGGLWLTAALVVVGGLRVGRGVVAFLGHFGGLSVCSVCLSVGGVFFGLIYGFEGLCALAVFMNVRCALNERSVRLVVERC